MSGNLLSLRQAARQLGVSRRRAEAMVLSRQLPAERVGRQWVVTPDAARRAARLRPAGGRPVAPRKAWALVDGGLTAGAASGRNELDRLRRKVRPRAGHAAVSVHPGAVAGLLHHGVLGGLDAASAAGTPVETGTVHDVYLRASLAPGRLEAAGARPASDAANVHVRVVADGAWPFAAGLRTAGLWSAWLDLADREDRAADTVLDRLVGGRIRA